MEVGITRRLLAAAATTAVGIAINFATDNTTNIFAWLLVAAATVLAAVLGGIGGSSSQRVKVRGNKNKLRQQAGANIDQATSIRGDENQTDQRG